MYSIDSNLSQKDKNYVEAICHSAKSATFTISKISTEKKNAVLFTLANLLKENHKTIINENQKDIKNAQQLSLSEAMVDRLILSDKSIDSMVQSLYEIIDLKDPVGEVITGWRSSNSLEFRKVKIPIGVIAVIYESRPNVTIDVGALALKSSNASILRGGKEAIHSNKILISYFAEALRENSLPETAVQLIDNPDKSLMVHLLKQSSLVDLIIPRGGSNLISFVNQNSHIPVVKHDKGVCHIYVDSSADKQQAEEIVLNAKIQRPGVCNAVETILLDHNFTSKEELLESLKKENVVLHGDEDTINQFASIKISPLPEESYNTEYLSMDISVKVVNGVDEAIAHIQKYGSSHSEAIISRDYQTIQTFVDSLQSAALFINASTRFHDGGKFGFGAEVGISTGKLHSRGPMGLTDLTTYKYIVQGNGQVRE